MAPVHIQAWDWPPCGDREYRAKIEAVAQRSSGPVEDSSRIRRARARSQYSAAVSDAFIVIWIQVDAGEVLISRAHEAP